MKFLSAAISVVLYNAASAENDISALMSNNKTAEVMTAFKGSDVISWENPYGKIYGNKVGKSGKTGKPHSKSKSRASKCITKAECTSVVNAFADAVVAISDAYIFAEGGPASSQDDVIDGVATNLKGCKAAYDAAKGALAAAYDYQGGTRQVLFKPTFASFPYTYRNELNGALSYFIGTECVLLAGTKDEVFPKGNMNGEIFQEYGFALNNFVGSDGIQREGYSNSYAEDFTYRTGGKNCETAIGVGRVCFVSEPTKSTSCVDKTFSFIRREIDESPVLTSHHSSSSITTIPPSITVCQEASDPSSPVDPDAPKCMD